MAQQAVEVSRKSESEKSEGTKEREQAVWASSNHHVLTTCTEYVLVH